MMLHIHPCWPPLLLPRWTVSMDRPGGLPLRKGTQACKFSTSDKIL